MKMYKHFNEKPDNSSLMKMIGLVSVVLLIIVIVGVYNGHKAAKLERINSIEVMKLSKGWKPELACNFLSKFGIKPINAYKESDKDFWECNVQKNMIYSKGSAAISYKISGVKNSATNMTMIVSYTDDRPSLVSTETQRAEVKSFKEVFNALTQELLLLGTGKMLNTLELQTLVGGIADKPVNVDTEHFYGAISHYQVSRGTYAYKLEVVGKRLDWLSEKAIQKK